MPRTVSCLCHSRGACLHKRKCTVAPSVKWFCFLSFSCHPNIYFTFLQQACGLSFPFPKIFLWPSEVFSNRVITLLHTVKAAGVDDGTLVSPTLTFTVVKAQCSTALSFSFTRIHVLLHISIKTFPVFT